MSIRLYELADQYTALQDLIDQGAEGFEEALAELKGELLDKVEAVALVIRSEETEAEGFKAEITRLQERYKSKTNGVKSLKDYLKAQMEEAGLDYVKGRVVDIRLQDSPPSVVVFDMIGIPSDYLSYTLDVPYEAAIGLGMALPDDKIRVDRRRILDEFKTTGAVPAGVTIEQSKHIRIR